MQICVYVSVCVCVCVPAHGMDMDKHKKPHFFLHSDLWKIQHFILTSVKKKHGRRTRGQIVQAQPYCGSHRQQEEDRTEN